MLAGKRDFGYVDFHGGGMSPTKPTPVKGGGALRPLRRCGVSERASAVVREGSRKADGVVVMLGQHPARHVGGDGAVIVG